MNLGEIRKKIDKIDDEMLDLFLERMGLATEVAKYKAANNMVVFQSDREKFIIDSVKENSPEELRKSAAFLFMNIMDISKVSQINAITPDIDIPYTPIAKERPSVAVQGIEGAYGHTAAKQLFGSGSISFYAAFHEVYEAVENGDVDYGIIPSKTAPRARSR